METGKEREGEGIVRRNERMKEEEKEREMREQGINGGYRWGWQKNEGGEKEGKDGMKIQDCTTGIILRQTMHNRQKCTGLDKQPELSTNLFFPSSSGLLGQSQTGPQDIDQMMVQNPLQGGQYIPGFLAGGLLCCQQGVLDNHV